MREGEYSAELWLIAKRALTEAQRVIYCEFFLADRPWYEVDKRTKLGRGRFFHEVYRTEQAIGAELIERPELMPDPYFGGILHTEPMPIFERGDVAAVTFGSGARKPARRLRERKGEAPLASAA